MTVTDLVHEFFYSPPKWIMAGIFIVLVGWAIGHFIKLIAGLQHDKTTEILEIFLGIFLAALAA